MITAKPMLYTGQNVRAIMDGRKTMTRRVVKLQSHNRAFVELRDNLGYVASVGYVWAGFGQKVDPVYVKCPYGAPGDLLYVREEIRGDGQPGDRRLGIMRYGADGEMVLVGDDEHGRADVLWSYKRPMLPAMLMRREYSRLTKRISNVRVERIQEISDLDCWAEGLDEDQWNEAEHYQVGGSPLRGGSAERCVFAALWDSIHGPGVWERNDFVWIVEWDQVWKKNVDTVIRELQAVGHGE